MAIPPIPSSNNMSLNYILPLKAPTPLPASGVDVVTFKVWRNTLIAHIQQDQHHHHFMPGGLYQVWQGAEYGTRIERINDADTDKVTLDGKRERLGEQAYTAQLATLRNLRNAQLAKFISHIATLCHHTENDDITTNSTSMDWIFEYLKKHYGLETKGANFMNISDHVFKKGTPSINNTGPPFWTILEGEGILSNIKMILPSLKTKDCPRHLKTQLFFGL